MSPARLNAALRKGTEAVVAELDRSACAIIKHGNPCGAALGSDPRTAFDRALECDPLSAFGGVIAFNRGVDGRAAEAIAKHFFEGVCVWGGGYPGVMTYPSPHPLPM